MNGISIGRVVVGGLVAGLIVNVFEFVVNGLLFEQAWAEVMRGLGKSDAMNGFAIAMFNLWGFAIAISAVWIYAALRPRFGPGPKTAVIAALFVWFVGYALAGVAPVATGVFPGGLVAGGAATGLVEIIAGTLAGARLYRDSPAPAGTKAAGA